MVHFTMWKTADQKTANFLQIRKVSIGVACSQLNLRMQYTEDYYTYHVRKRASEAKMVNFKLWKVVSRGSVVLHCTAIKSITWSSVPTVSFSGMLYW